MTVPGRFALPSRQDQQQLAQHWSTKPAIGRDVPDPKMLAGDFPFRARVQFAWCWFNKNLHLVAREDGVYAEVAFDNIGYFLKGIENARHLEAVLSVLHEGWVRRRLTVEQLLRILRAIEVDGKDLPLKTLKTSFDADLLAKGCFTKDGVWFADFAIIEGASVVEYKYAIDRQNRVARLRRVLVEGPPSRGFGHYPNTTVVAGVLQGGKPAESPAPPKTVAEPETQPSSEAGPLCTRFLQTAARLPDWKKGGADSDVAVRRDAACGLRGVAEEARSGKRYFRTAAQGIACDLARALRDPDDKVRYAAQGGLAAIGLPAVPELRKALIDEDKRVRMAAAEVVSRIGPPAKDAVPELVKTLAEKDSNMILWAAEALATIGEAAVPELRKAFCNEHRLTRFAAVRTLARIGPAAKDAVPDLRKMLGDKDDMMRERAAWALASIGPAAQAALPDLRKALRDPSSEVRKVAENAIKKIEREER